MEAILEKTTKEDQRIARHSVGKLGETSGKLRRGTRQVIKIKFQDSGGFVEIPAKAMKMLSAIVNYMAVGKSVALVFSDTTLTTQQAAEYLNVSRPYVVKLLENGEIPFTKAGTHRRIEFTDLLTYSNKAKSNRSKHLNFLARQAQELNLGY